MMKTTVMAATVAKYRVFFFRFTNSGATKKLWIRKMARKRANVFHTSKTSCQCIPCTGELMLRM